MSNENADSVEIVVNGQQHRVPKGEICHGDLVRIAFNVEGDAAQPYTVTYEDGKKSDVLPFGGCIKVKKDMVFDVIATGMS
ncbi:hypothetical protein [Altererythrobacter sp.]|uniref:hypothetical protein n=1 Tax=Altererythrobacter sp. TaxID=1872480 RepID=UPI003CFE25C2